MSCGHVVPGLALVVGRLEVVVDVLEIDADVAAPAAASASTRRSPGVLRRKSRIHAGSFFISEIWCDDLGVEPLAGLEDVLLVGAEIVLIDLADRRRGLSVVRSVAMIVISLFERHVRSVTRRVVS